MKTKAERKEFIRSRAIALNMVAVAAFLTVSKGEIRETVRETKAKFTESMDDETRDESEIGNKSQLSFDEIKTAKDAEENYLLSPKERAELKRELANRRESFALPERMEFV
jgi:hypothetical protein